MFDLQAMRDARREKAGKPHSVKWNGKVMKLPQKLPLKVILAMSEVDDSERDPGALKDMLQALLGEKNFEMFLAGDPDTDDLEDLLQGVLDLYGLAPSGEALAASPS